jgi:hypothetical protein
MKTLNREAILNLEPGALDPKSNGHNSEPHKCAAQTIEVGAMVTRSNRLNLKACRTCKRIVTTTGSSTLTDLVKALPAADLEGKVAISFNPDGLCMGFPN